MCAEVQGLGITVPILIHNAVTKGRNVQIGFVQGAGQAGPVVAVLPINGVSDLFRPSNYLRVAGQLNIGRGLNLEPPLRRGRHIGVQRSCQLLGRLPRRAVVYVIYTAETGLFATVEVCRSWTNQIANVLPVRFPIGTF